MTKVLLNELDDFIQVELLDKNTEEACHLRSAWDEIYTAAMREIRSKENFPGYQVPGFLQKVGA